ncbi:MAG: DUF6513 domain-containing protein [Alphaproteobacteria bacterium]|nr:DUF6513 domain-containing protein [Alphaproteobacteria bacterium]
MGDNPDSVSGAARKFERILFLTGHLAEPRLRRILTEMEPLPFAATIRDLGIQVAGLMTTDLIRRRLTAAEISADLVLVPGRCRGDLTALGQEFGVEFRRGPDDVGDLPQYFRMAGRDQSPFDSRDSCRIFAEITNAPQLSVAEILAKATGFIQDGAQVIDLGCLPESPFPHLGEAVQSLKQAGFQVSVDSASVTELRVGAAAGCDYLLSLNETRLELAFESAAIPVLIPNSEEEPESLYRAAEILTRANRPFIADPILAPIGFGFAKSLERYGECRKRLPEARILMGIGNLTELTDADSSGVTAMLFGIIAELAITEVLTVQDSPHCRRAIAEAAAARQLCFAAVEEQRLPQQLLSPLLTVRDRNPFATSATEIAATVAGVRDSNFRIEVAEDGIHLYNRDGHWIETRAENFAPILSDRVETSHGFYLGGELTRAEIAFQLGKRFNQDEELDWGIATVRRRENLLAHKASGKTKPKPS